MKLSGSAQEGAARLNNPLLNYKWKEFLAGLKVVYNDNNSKCGMKSALQYMYVHISDVSPAKEVHHPLSMV